MDSVDEAGDFWGHQDAAEARDVTCIAASYFDEKYVRRMTGSEGLTHHLWNLLKSNVCTAKRNDFAGCALESMKPLS